MNGVAAGFELGDSGLDPVQAYTLLPLSAEIVQEEVARVDIHLARIQKHPRWLVISRYKIIIM